MKLNMLLAMIVMSSISLSAMEERELVVAPGKSKEATKQLHDCFYHAHDNPEFQGMKLYNKLEECFQMGADPNAEILWDGVPAGYPLLKWLSLYCSPDDQHRVPPSLIPLVIKYGGEIDKKSGKEQTNALHIAAYRIFESNYKKAHMLLQCGADVNCQDGNGRTPLNRRKYDCNNPYFFKLLLIYGADPFIKDNDGYDALTDNWIGGQRDAEQRRSTYLVLYKQAQELLALKKQKESEGAPLQEIQQHFKKADFPYPYRGIATDDSQVFLIRR